MDPCGQDSFLPIPHHVTHCVAVCYQGMGPIHPYSTHPSRGPAALTMASLVSVAERLQNSHLQWGQPCVCAAWACVFIPRPVLTQCQAMGCIRNKWGCCSWTSSPAVCSLMCIAQAAKYPVWLPAYTSSELLFC